MIGFRSTMEDADICLSSLPSPLEGKPPCQGIRPRHSIITVDWSFFAVLDGHGGDEVAKRAANLMLPVLLNQPQIAKITNAIEYVTGEVRVSVFF